MIFREYYQQQAEYSSKSQSLSVMWHGGEPLIIGRDKFARFLQIQAEENHTGCLTNNYVQTNGILLDDEWLDFLQRHNIFVGVSFDGPKVVDEVHRIDQNGGSHFEEVMKNIELLEQAEFPYCILSVATSETHSRESSQEFVKFFSSSPFGKQLQYVDFLFGYEPAKARGNISSRQYYQFMKAVRDNPNRCFRVRLLDEIESLANGQEIPNFLHCELGGACGTLHYVTKTGDLYPCVTLPLSKELKMGNIHDGLEHCLASENFVRFQKIYNDIDEHCSSCDVLSTCRAGCAARREKVTMTGDDNVDISCSARKALISNSVS